MRSLLRGLACGLLVLGLIAVGSSPADLSAQDKKKDPAPPKKPADDPKPKPDDKTREKVLGFATSDGLTLQGYWFQGNAIDKQRPDAVLMFPAWGNKVNDAWIGLAKDLSEKNFSVLLFDWRGCGMNDAATAGSRIFEDKGLFWNEKYNSQLLKANQTSIESKGLDFKSLKAKQNDLGLRYQDFMLNDLTAARFYLDKQNDNGKCNTNRIWIVTEKDGGQLALAFITYEFGRNTLYSAKKNVFDNTQFRSAGKDYVGLTCLSYAAGNSTATAVGNNAVRLMSNPPAKKEAEDHLRERLSMVMMYGKKEGPTASKNAIHNVGASGTDEDMRKRFKYLREVDNSKGVKAISGIDLIDPMDSFGTKADIVKAMSEVILKQNIGKDSTDREANKIVIIPRFPAETLGRR